MTTNVSPQPTYYCAMSKKRYAAIISTINNLVDDVTTRSRLISEIQRIINFNPDFCTYTKENAEKRRQQRQQKKIVKQEEEKCKTHQEQSEACDEASQDIHEIKK